MTPTPSYTALGGLSSRHPANSGVEQTLPPLSYPKLRYLSVCSGIEAATQAFHPLGWQPVAFSEIEPFPCAVLKHHYPDVPNWGDMTKFQEWPDADVDVLCGGTPCQSFSVAGLRQGLADPRGNLMLTFGAIADRYRPKWLVWENVPGVLSSNGGRDFGAFLGMLGELGYGVAYRVLDAQFVRTRRFPHAVPQRRRRVFVVGYLGDWRRAAAVLFDRESLSGHPAPSRKAGQGSAARSARSLAIRGREGIPSVEVGDDVANAILTPNGGRGGVGVGAALIESNSGDIGYCLTASAQGSLDAETETLIAQPVSFGAQNAAAQGDGVAVGFVAALDKSKTPAVAFDMDGAAHCIRSGASKADKPDSTTYIATTPWAVRRLTPRECERLQGFPDDFTRIPYRGKPADLCPDGPRYKALGNSWAVNCADWIAERLAEVDAWPNETLNTRITGDRRPRVVGQFCAGANTSGASTTSLNLPGAAVPGLFSGHNSARGRIGDVDGHAVTTEVFRTNDPSGPFVLAAPQTPGAAGATGYTPGDTHCAASGPPTA